VQHIQEYCEGAPIGLFGHSLGGFLSAATLIRNPAVRAGVILSGGLDEESARAVKRTAPTLILHGSADTRVPLAEAQRLEAALIAAGARPEMRVYRGEGHTLELASYADALDRATRFLREHLA
jgi:dipeptidyl aminopeptidase/acylaminoacyl peptidase